MAVPGAKSIGGDVIRQNSADVFGGAAEGATGLKKFGLGALEKGAKGIAEAQNVFQNLGDASIGEIAKASFPAVTQGSIDAGIATARRALKDYEDELAEYERLTGEAQTASDDARRTAIRAAMIAGGHSEDVISETFDLLGLKDGGRVGLREGGLLQQLTAVEQIQPGSTPQNFIPGLGRPGFQPFARPLLSAGQMPVFPRLRELEQGIDTAESDLGSIRSRLGNQEGRLGGLTAIQPSYGIQPLNMGRLPLQLQAARLDASQGMKEGGLMDRDWETT